jgi:hypothetical protein
MWQQSWIGRSRGLQRKRKEFLARKFGIWATRVIAKNKSRAWCFSFQVAALLEEEKIPQPSANIYTYMYDDKGTYIGMYHACACMWPVNSNNKRPLWHTGSAHCLMAARTGSSLAHSNQTRSEVYNENHKLVYMPSMAIITIASAAPDHSCSLL